MALSRGRAPKPSPWLPELAADEEEAQRLARAEREAAVHRWAQVWVDRAPAAHPEVEGVYAEPLVLDWLDDGLGMGTGRGYVFRSPGHGHQAPPGMVVLSVADTAAHLVALQSDGFGPGAPLLLRSESAHPLDPSPVGVYDLAGSTRGGCVPRAMSETVTAWCAAPAGVTTLNLYEALDGKGRRVGLKILIAPVAALDVRLTLPPPPGI